MLLPTNPSIHEGFTTLELGKEGSSLDTLLDPASPQKLMYSLYIVEALVKINPVKIKDQCDNSFEPNAWRKHFVECGGLRHLFDVFVSGKFLRLNKNVEMRAGEIINVSLLQEFWNLRKGVTGVNGNKTVWRRC